LLAAPILQAYAQRLPAESLHQSVTKVLQTTTIEDCCWVYKAITCASPGGLGRSSEQDVEQLPEVTLLEAMKIAADKDKVAYQYSNDFKDIFEFTILEYNSAINFHGSEHKAILSVFANYLNRFPDSHIVRKYGDQHLDWVKDQIQQLVSWLENAQDEELFENLQRMDIDFKTKRINPGTTADITVTTLLVVLLESQIARSDSKSF
jgi:triphosphoribosyl-dephospho-CoA synthase